MEQPVTDSVEAPETEPTEVIDTTETESDSDLSNQTPEEDEAEEELEGVKLRGKKEALERLKAERLMQSDYTRKTQEVAEQRKAIEAEKAQHQQLTQSYLREVAQIVSVDDRLSQYGQVDWQRFNESDPVKAQAAWFDYQQLRDTKTSLVNNLTQKQQQDAMQQQQSHAKQLQEAQAIVAREIKGWSPELANKLMSYGKEQGFPAEVLGRVNQPAFVKVLHKAHLYDQLMQKRQPAAPATPPPVTRVSGSGATATKKLSQMSDAEYAAARRSYIAKHR